VAGSSNNAGYILLRSQKTQYPAHVYESMVQLSTHLNIHELHATALYAEASNIVAQGGEQSSGSSLDVHEVAVDLFYKERILCFKSCLDLLPLLGADNTNNNSSLAALQSRIIELFIGGQSSAVPVVNGMLQVIDKYLKLYNESTMVSASATTNNQLSSNTNKSAFAKVREEFYKQVLQSGTSILFLLYYNVPPSAQFMNSVVKQLRTISSSTQQQQQQQVQLSLDGNNGNNNGDDDCKSMTEFIIAKLLVVCLTALDSATSTTLQQMLPYVLDLKPLLDDIKSWSEHAEPVLGTLNAAYGLYLEAVSSDDDDECTIRDEIGRILHEGYVLTIFKYLRCDLLPNLLQQEDEDAIVFMEELYIGILVIFVGRFTSTAVVYAELPQPFAQWLEDAEYNAQLTNQPVDYQNRDDVLEDVVSLIIELCRLKHPCALRFLEAVEDAATAATLPFQLSAFLQTACLEKLPLDHSVMLLAALSYGDAIYSVHAYLKSGVSAECNWNNLLRSLEKHTQTSSYFSPYRSSAAPASGILTSHHQDGSMVNNNGSKAESAKVILALIARCAQNEEVKKWLFQHNANLMRIVMASPNLGVTNLCTLANLVGDGAGQVEMVFDWIDRLEISSMEPSTSRGFLILYHKLLSILAQRPTSNRLYVPSIQVHKFMQQIVGFLVAGGSDTNIDLLFDALNVTSLISSHAQVKPYMSLDFLDVKLRKGLLKLFIRFSINKVDDNRFIGGDDSSNFSSFLASRHHSSDVMDRLLSILCHTDTDLAIVDIQSILYGLGNTLGNDTNAASALQFLTVLSQNSKLQQFIFGSSQVLTALTGLLNTHLSDDVFKLLADSLPMCLDYVKTILDELVIIPVTESMTNLFCKINRYSGKKIRTISFMLHQRGYIPQSLQNLHQCEENLVMFADLLNLYAAELFSTKLVHVNMQVLIRSIPMIAFNNKKGSVRKQVEINRAFGRLLSLLSTLKSDNATSTDVHNLIMSILRRMSHLVCNNDVLSSCFFPIALGIFDLLMRNKANLSPFHRDISDALFAILSRVQGATGMDLLAFVMAKFTNDNEASQATLKLLVRINEEGTHARAEAGLMTSAIVELLSKCASADYNSIAALAKSNDMVLMMKLADSLDGASVLVQTGVASRVVKSYLASIQVAQNANDPTIVISTLSLLLKIHKHQDVSPEISLLLTSTHVSTMFRQLLRQFPYYADVTELLLLAISVTNSGSTCNNQVEELYAQLILEFMQVVALYPFPPECLPELDPVLLRGSDTVCWWHAFPSPAEGPDSVTLPPPPAKLGHRSNCIWTTEHCHMSVAAIRILNVCAKYLINVYHRSGRLALAVDAQALAIALCRFVDASRAVEEYCKFLRGNVPAIHVADVTEKALELEYIEALAPLIGIFVERLLGFVALHSKLLKPEASFVDSVRRMLEYTRIEDDGLGCVSLLTDTAFGEEKKQSVEDVSVSGREYGCKIATYLDDVIANASKNVDALTAQGFIGGFA